MEQVPLRIPIVTIGTGGHFGEFALIDDSKRQASVICIKDTHLLTISKFDYKELMEKAEKRQQEKLLDFWRSIPYLK